MNSELLRKLLIPTEEQSKNSIDKPCSGSGPKPAKSRQTGTQTRKSSYRDPSWKPEGEEPQHPTATAYQAGQHTNITTSSRAEHPVYLAQEPKQVKQTVAAASNQRWPFASRNS
ncbi:hypothetical protein TESG_02562 [Trichophyton tonsurans CBS 112818]|uniref:Uncharacterized protein n=1 Tax=Trichophyton tonsurans (strain CBS 112818) TaxID=647933 RepID=F2RV21_TRIT1|nr:hypothetical protein TESG_02562 [Trichophyton tonsurans CBS 112818]